MILLALIEAAMLAVLVAWAIRQRRGHRAHVAQVEKQGRNEAYMYRVMGDTCTQLLADELGRLRGNASGLVAFMDQRGDEVIAALATRKAALARKEG